VCKISSCANLEMLLQKVQATVHQGRQVLAVSNHPRCNITWASYRLVCIAWVQHLDCFIKYLRAQLCMCACLYAVHCFCSICLDCLQGPASICTGILMQNLVSQCPANAPCHSSQQWHTLSAQAIVELFGHRVRIHAASHWEQVLCIHDLSACSAH